MAVFLNAYNFFLGQGDGYARAELSPSILQEPRRKAKSIPKHLRKQASAFATAAFCRTKVRSFCSAVHPVPDSMCSRLRTLVSGSSDFAILDQNAVTDELPQKPV